MNVLIVGAGPAGLTLARFLKGADPSCAVRVIDRRRPDDHVGWGIGLPLATLRQIGHDPSRYHPVRRAQMRYQDRSYAEAPIDVWTIGRDVFVGHLTRTALEMGVEIEFGREVGALEDIDAGGVDLVVGADGVNSSVRRSLEEHFSPSLWTSPLHYTWLATPRLFGDVLPSVFLEHRGALFVAWSYQHSPSQSTWIVECTPSGLEAAGLRDVPGDVFCRRVAELFRTELEGRPVEGGPRWRLRRFQLLRARRWTHGHVALIGDAAHTTHFSRGFGTELAIGDAECLARHLARCASVEAALEAYERERMPEVARHQAMAAAQSNWYRSVIEAYERGSVFAVPDAIARAEAAIAKNGPAGTKRGTANASKDDAAEGS